MNFRKSMLSMCLAFTACTTAQPSADAGTDGGGSSTGMVVEVTADLTADTTWTHDHVYVLKQLTYVASGTLTIEAGTTVLGDSASALIVSRDAKLVEWRYQLR